MPLCFSVYSLQCPTLYPTSLLTLIVATHCSYCSCFFTCWYLCIMSSTAPASPPSPTVSDGSTDGVSHPLSNIVMAETLPSVPPVSHCGTSKQTCAHQDCNRALPSISHDPHSVCITCHGFCFDTLRCEECAGWDVVVVEGARSYQSKLARCHFRYPCSKQ